MKNLILLFVFMGGLSSCLSEFEGELGNNIFENPSDPFLEVTTHEKETDLAELFFTSRINFDDFEKIKGIVIFENGNQLQSIIEDPNRNSFIRDNLIPFRQYCYKIAYLDDEDRTVAESEEYCFSF